MLNTPYGDSWLMAPPSSYVARLIADAGGQYVYTQDTGNQSRPIDTEEAYRLAEMSDCWINVGYRRIAQGTSGDRPQIHGYAPRAGREGL